MIVCLPICTRQEKVDWSVPPFRDLLNRLFAEVRSLGESFRPVVAVDSDAMDELARSAGLTAVARVSAESAFSPREQAVALLQGREPDDTPVLVVDYRNPFVTRQVIEEAAAEYGRETDSPLASVETPEDHPVQLRKLCNVVDAGLIHILDPAGPASISVPAGFRAACVSKPFPFDWQGVSDRYSGHTAFVAGSAGELLPLEEGDGEPAFWLREGAGHARVVWTGEPDPSVVGLSVDGEAVMASGEGGDVRLMFDQKTVFDLHVAPFGVDGLAPDSPSALAVKGGVTTTARPGSEVHGFVYTAVDTASDGGFSCERFFDPDGTLWCVDSQEASDGTKLFGRQSFPDVYAVDGSVLVGSVEQLGAFDRLLGSGLVRMYRFNEGGAIIRTRFDFVRYLAGGPDDRTPEKGDER